MSDTQENDPHALSQHSSRIPNDVSRLTEEHLKKFEMWKTQAAMAHIKIEYIDFDHENRLVLEHLSEADRKRLNETKDANENTGEPAKKRLKGQNRKHLEVNARTKGNLNDHQLCFFTVRSGVTACPYQSECKHSHDLKSYLPRRSEDLQGKCEMFEKYGRCFYGILCRYGQSHIDPLTGENRIETEGRSIYAESLNKYPPLLKSLLRRKKYDFSLSDRVVRTANKEITKANIAKRSQPTNNEETEVQNDGKDQQSLDNFYYAALTSKKPDSTVEEKEQKDEPIINDNENKTDETTDQQTSSRPVPFRTIGTITDVDLIRLKPREKQRIDFRQRLYLAPLTTVGNLPFRRVCKDLGCEITCGEMAMTTSLLQGQMSEFALLRRHPSEKIFGIQLCGSFVDTMTRTVQMLEENFDFDFIDLNCACPIDLVYKKGAGCALTRRSIDFERICRAVSCVSTHPITVKLRTGILTGENNAHEVISLAKSWKAKEDDNHVVELFTLHGRSKEMRYSKNADWNYVDQCAQVADPIPLYGVGDIYSFKDYYQHLEETNVSGCMIARGALIKPWIFTEIQERRDWDISASERFDILKRYTNYGLEHWGSDQAGVEKTRRFLLEWISFLYRYIPVGLLERLPHRINERPPYFFGRNDLETLMSSKNCSDWIKLTELLLGKVGPDFQFLPKHKANAYA